MPFCYLHGIDKAKVADILPSILAFVDTFNVGCIDYDDDTYDSFRELGPTEMAVIEDRIRSYFREPKLLQAAIAKYGNGGWDDDSFSIYAIAADNEKVHVLLWERKRRHANWLTQMLVAAKVGLLQHVLDVCDTENIVHPDVFGMTAHRQIDFEDFFDNIGKRIAFTIADSYKVVPIPYSRDYAKRVQPAQAVVDALREAGCVLPDDFNDTIEQEWNAARGRKCN